MTLRFVGVLVVTAAFLVAGPPAFAGAKDESAAKPLKVFVLAGQSNMQGHAQIATFDSLADDPKTAPLLKLMRGADGTPAVCERVWISSIGCQGDAYSDLREQTGKLTAGFGAFGVEGRRIGPEFTFGLTMERRLNEPILIIKTAWGGRSLHTDFRPPSGGPRKISDQMREQWKSRGLDVEQETEKIRGITGVFYRHMIEHVKAVLKDIPRVVPDHDPKRGYELAGFVWFQGWNDMVDGGIYPDRMKPGGYDEYAELLGHLIRDVRRDLSAPKMPFVIGVMGVGGEKDGKKAPQMHFRAAQAKPATVDEFKGNVVAVETSPFWDDELDALKQRMDSLNGKLDQEFKKNPKLTREEKEAARKKATDEQFQPDELKRLKVGVSNGGYHYLGAAKILAPIGEAFANALVPADGKPKKAAVVKPPRQSEMAGYLLVPHERVDPQFNGGFSMYVAAWPLLKHYPGQDFQSGLFGTWMFAQYDGKKPEKAYSDIEGGLGWWRDTRFATETPKFIMGGVALNFVEWANGPGAGKGRDWKNPKGHYAIAQLSPWVLWPPDGLNLKQGTSGELFGYGYLPLPLTAAKKTTAGQDVPTGNHFWTLFLNTGNFKGPVTFFVPYFWTKPTLEKPELGGMFLDTKPSDPNKAVQMETQHVPAFTATDATGGTWARVAPTRFPAQAEGDAPLIHRITAYRKAALWDGVQAWFDGGAEATGEINPQASAVHTFKGGGGATWQIYPPGTPREKKAPVAWSSFATPTALDDTTWGYRWAKDAVTTAAATKAGATADGGADESGANESGAKEAGAKADGAKARTLVTLPEYFRLETDEKGKERWVVASAQDVPAETGLAGVEFPRRRGTERGPYVTPDEPDSSWKKPGPAAGPFTATLGDGSVVTYYWYRFADQPALQHADLTADEREALQKKVEKIHRRWTKDRQYLPPNTIGTLADLDPALLVTPPEGKEIGYVPIVTRQEAK